MLHKMAEIYQSQEHGESVNEKRTIAYYKTEKRAATEKTKMLLTETAKIEKSFVGLRLAALADNKEEHAEEKRTLNRKVTDLEQLAVSDKMYCSYCECDFVDRPQQTSHYKTDWHRYNLKRKIRGLQSLSQESFEKMLGSDISSISGSGSSSEGDLDDSDSGKEKKVPAFPKRLPDQPAGMSDSDDEESVHVEGVGRRHPRVFVRNDEGEMYSIYRCVIHGKKNQPEDGKELLSMVTDMHKNMKWAIFMTAAGHVAAAIFDKDEVIAHKTFHRYTVRAKRGTAQGLRDSTGNAPHSAGASLRRYNEAALNQEVSDLIKSWSEQLKSCDRIFLRAPSFNRAMFFSGKAPPLDKRDPRIRFVPFPTRRPTFSELKRVQELLATVECYGAETTIHDHVQTSPKRPSTLKKTKPSTDPELNIDISRNLESDEGEDIEPSELIGADETIQMGHLQPFECTKKPKKKKKKKNEKHKTDVKPIVEEEVETPPHKIYNDEEYKYRNDLYTACKLEDKDRVRELLKALLPSDDSQSTSSTEDANEGITPEPKLPSDSPAACGLSEEPSRNETTVSVSDHSCLSIPVGDGQTCVATPDLISEPFSEARRTLLGVAATQSSREIVGYLLEAGADPTIRDSQNRPPYILATEKSTRNEFRKFMSKYPNRYDYMLAQIPAPLTAEMEAERKAKEAERKKAAKKAKKERLKDKRAEEATALAEKREEERFMKLSDREKRAIAAERRLTAQMSSVGEALPVLSRCWQCGCDITGKVPFEYYDYKFCSPKCLKDHKMASAQKKT